MPENLKYYRLTVKDGTGVSITVITDKHNEKKVLESAQGQYDVVEIPPDPELLKNARVVKADNPIPYNRAPSFSAPEILERYQTSVRDMQNRMEKDRRQQNKFAARQHRKK